jgi:hypothetical protein
MNGIEDSLLELGVVSENSVFRAVDATFESSVGGIVSELPTNQSEGQL